MSKTIADDDDGWGYREAIYATIAVLFFSNEFLSHAIATTATNLHYCNGWHIYITDLKIPVVHYTVKGNACSFNSG